MSGSRLIKVFALLLGLALTAIACGGGGGDGAEVADTIIETTVIETTTIPEPEQTPPARDREETSGVLVWVHDQEPPDLHLDDPNNTPTITAWIREALLDSLFGVDATLSYYPELLAGEPVLTLKDNGSVLIEYTLRSGLEWSDGSPFTSADVEYTHRIITEGCRTEADGSIVDGTGEDCIYLMGNRSGLDLVTSFDVSSDTEFSITMASFFAGWRGLYSQVYAEHAFGADAAAVNENLRDFDGLPSTGPMVFDSWDRGVSMNLARNENYHGSVSPDATNQGPASVEGVRIDFVGDADSVIDTVLAGRAHIVMTQVDPAFERLVASDDFTVATVAGPSYEHLGLNLLNTHLAKPEVREAIAYALDKSEIVTKIYNPLFGSLPADGLGNTYWMTNQPPYEDHQSRYAGHNVSQAKASLEAAGYVLGRDGVYAHPIDGRLSLRVGTTGGKTLRERQEELIQQQLADAGIEITIDNVAGGAYFRERPFAEAAIAASKSDGAAGDPTIWDITQFAWLGGPWPGGQSGSYRPASDNNPYGFNNEEFGVQASECDATVEDAERAACYNELDRYVTTLEKSGDGLFMIPLTQKPSFFGYSSRHLSGAGVAPDSTSAGPLSNVVDYELQG